MLQYKYKDVGMNVEYEDKLKRYPKNAAKWLRSFSIEKKLIYQI